MTNYDPDDFDIDPVATDEASPISLGRRRALTLIAGAGLTAVVGGVAAFAKGGSAPAEAANAEATTTTLRRTSQATTSTTVDATTTTTPTAAATATTAKKSTAATSSSETTATTQPPAAATATTGSGPIVGAIPQETGGPFPADGTNGPNVLTQSGIVRSDIRSSFAGASGTADGVLLDIELTLVQAGTGVLLPGAAVYLWHCDRSGNYSQYGQATAANYLRGVGVADANGVVRFRSIFPAAYDGRWPHIHFQIFANQAAATTGRNAVRTTQLALPPATCQQVYATTGYEASVANLSHTSLTTDMVFADGVDKQLATISGSTGSGLLAQLAVGI